MQMLRALAELFVANGQVQTIQQINGGFMYSRLISSGLVVAACAVSIVAFAQEIALEPTSAGVSLRPVKVGDKITYQRRKYSQADAAVDAVLDQDVTSVTLFVEPQDDGSRGFKAKSGQIDLYDKSYTLIGSITKDGEKKLVAPDRLFRWMPEGGVKPGAEWEFKNEWVTKTSTGSGRDCYHTEVFKAVSKPAYRDIKISGALVRVNVVEITLNGAHSARTSASSCAGNGFSSAKTIVYSKELDLVLESGSLEHDDFKKIRGSANRLDVVTAIN